MPGGLDHLVVAVRDLDAAAAFYQRLGFQVGARNQHPWGTANRLIQFPGAFVELVGLGEGGEVPPHGTRSFSFGAFVRDYLARREGIAMLVLDTDDAKADSARFAGSGIGDFEPFFFERRGRRPDGSETHVAFTLAFARDENAPGAGFFVCQHHYPENFWNEAFQQHPNRALGLSSVVLTSPAPAQHKRFLDLFTGASAAETGSDLSYPLARAQLDVLTADDAAESYGSIDAEPDRGCFVAFAVRVADIEQQARNFDTGSIPYQRIGSRLVVASSGAFGVAIAFEPA
jgi:catechol 2,3-dioxygenase-like lactoylglutathione lyase family enzyme